MTALERFEKLGYKQTKKDEWNTTYEKGEKKIEFSYYWKGYMVKEGAFAGYVDDRLHKAIVQQLLELEWI